MKKRLIIVPLAVLGFCAALYVGLREPFGALPSQVLSGERLARIEASPNFRNGEFHNQIDTPMLSSGKNRGRLFWETFFAGDERVRPEKPLPGIKTDLRALPEGGDFLVWLGHSSLFLRLGGRNILIDPVFSAYASPLPFINRAFDGGSLYQPEDMPNIDCLVLSHDHWDHLDYATLKALKPKIDRVICPLGVGAHLEYWGFDKAVIYEADWEESLEPLPELKIHILPARHFSGRSLTSNKTLWASFLFESGRYRVFYSGDSGYGPHFNKIAHDFGPVNWAILEDGQYGPDWKYIHMSPEEVLKAARDLQAKAMLPVHAGRFALSRHAWDEPYRKLAAAVLAAEEETPFLATPVMGQPIALDEVPDFSPWWE